MDYRWKEQAPFDAIFTAAAGSTPEPLWSQLREGEASDCLKGKEGQLQRSIRARKINDRQITRISAQLFLCR
jgi:protein-L-isoaspartate O-methyltransferase